MVVRLPAPGLQPQSSAHRAPGDTEEAEAVNTETEVRMELAPGPGVFDARHTDNTEVLLALLTQNKELEGESLSSRVIYSFNHPILSYSADLVLFESMSMRWYRKVF